jgi:hypothetical protein
MKKRLWVPILFLFVAATIIGMLVIPNPLGEQLLVEAKYRGYLAYTPEEAVTLAYDRCTTCHSEEKMLKYCARCGPPFIVVSHSMKKYVEIINLNGENFKPFSDAELVAITQVWNGLIGDWEPDWGLKDIKKLLQGDRALIRLAETPLEERPIQMALKDKSAPGAYKEIYTFDDKQPTD